MWARSYTLRAVLALGMLVLFYAVAISLGLGLMALPYFEMKLVGRVHLKLALAGLVGGGLILWSLVPRRVPWEDPGPRISESEQPRLFALIREVATKMGSEMPAEVYLVPDVNAFVTQRGGFLGFGSRKVLGVGIPLLAVQNVSELRAVLTHEFGHYAGGDSHLGGLIYATRSAMTRALRNLHQGGSLLYKPFEWMLKAYLRITQAISRQQELLADEWSVRLNGVEAHSSALRVSGLHGTGFSLFLRNEVDPLVANGVVPDNVFEGYRRFLGSSSWTELRPRIAESMKEEKSDPYDSHPALEERLAFARQVQAPAVPVDTTPAWTLLEGGQALEVRFSEALRGEGAQVVTWDEIPRSWQRMWNRMADRAQARVPELTLGAARALRGNAPELERFAERVVPRLVGYRMADRERQVRETAARYLGAYLGSVLGRGGWNCHTAPGEPLVLEREGQRVDPTDLARRLVEGTLPAEELERLQQQSGLTDAAAWELDAEARKSAAAPLSEVQVEPGKKHTEVVAPLQTLFLPRCCAVCCGPGEYVAEVNHVISGVMSDRSLSFEVVLCEAHQKEAQKAFTARKYDEKTGLVTLQFPNPDYVRLLQQANA